MPEDRRIGATLADRYRVVRQIARASNRALYEAEHVYTGRRVALKITELAGDRSRRSLERVLLEARSAAELRHPHVVDVLDSGFAEDGAAYLAMELLEGRSLGDHLRRRERLSPAELLRTLLPILGAVAVAHDRGIVHRDLKPDNIFLATGPDGSTRPTLLDFGIAKLAHAPGVTTEGTTVGTVHYMSPEQAMASDAVGYATDIWALGVICYECLSGALPFRAESLTGVLLRIVNEPAPELIAARPDLPVGFADAVQRALSRRPEARYAGAREMALALALAARQAAIALPEDPDPVGLPDWKSWLSSGPVAATTRTAERPATVAQPAGTASLPPASTPGRRPLAVGAALLVAAGVGAWLWWGAAQDPPAGAAPARAAPSARAPLAPSPAPEVPLPPSPVRPEPSERGAASDAGTTPATAPKPPPSSQRRQRKVREPRREGPPKPRRPTKKRPAPPRAGAATDPMLEPDPRWD